MTAIGVFTATSWVPAGTRIFPSVPSSTASTSIVALSVSISAITSPDFTWSPSFFSHLARLPFSMVGDSAGINTSVGTGLLRSTRHVGPKLRCIGLRRVGREIGGFVDDGTNLGVDFFDFFFGRSLLAHAPRPYLLNRIMLGADLFNFLARTIFLRIRHGVAAIAVGLHLKDIGSLAAAGIRDRLFAGELHRPHIHAVHLLARNAEGYAAFGEIGLGRRALDCRAHGVLIVLDHVDHRQLPQLRHVEALVHLSLVRRAIAEVGLAHAAVLAVAVRECDAGAERHLGSDDAVSTEEVLLDGEHMHRTALAFGVARTATGKLGHDALRIHAAGEHMAVVAVGGDHLIAVLGGELHADDDGFLTDVEVAEPADEAHAVHLAGLFLEAADEQHLAIGTDFLLRRERLGQRARSACLVGRT